MTMLSVNLNKVALLRNARQGASPDIVAAAEACLAEGAGGMTLHPRPDERHARPGDVRALTRLARRHPACELNIEGNPFPEFMALVRETRPTQCTLVPDGPGVLTSDRGWDLRVAAPSLRPLIDQLKSLQIRVSLFMEADADQMELARAIGADRVELYTEPYARAAGTPESNAVLQRFAAAARAAQRCGLGVNAGHDLNLENLGPFCATVPRVLEVSIGHALVARALTVGLRQAVSDYLAVLAGSAPLH